MRWGGLCRLENQIFLCDGIVRIIALDISYGISPPLRSVQSIDRLGYIDVARAADLESGATEYVQQKWSDDPANLEQAYRLAIFCEGKPYEISSTLQTDK